MTWEELVEKAKEFKYLSCETEDDVYLYGVRGNLYFYKDGGIEHEVGGFCATNRTYEQMYQIIKALGE